MRSLIISLVAQLVALGMLCLIAIGVLVHIFNWEFTLLDPQEGIKQISALAPSIGLGIVYAIFQSIFFCIASFFWQINLVGFLLITWISNGIGAMISYMFIHMSELMKYVG